MSYKDILYIIFFLYLSNCTTGTLIENKSGVPLIKGYNNKGFALIYNDNLYKQKIVSKKINERSLTIFQRNLKIMFMHFANSMMMEAKLYFISVEERAADVYNT